MWWNLLRLLGVIRLNDETKHCDQKKPQQKTLNYDDKSGSKV